MTGIIQRLRHHLPVGGFGRGVLALVVGTGLGQLVVIVSSPVLTRLYSPSDFGVYSAAISILAVSMTVACLRYESAILIPEADVAAANLLALSLLVAVGTTVALALVLVAFGPTLLTLVGASALGASILLLPIGHLGGAIAGALRIWAVRTRSFSDIAATRLAQGVALVAVQVGLGVVGFGVAGLLVGDIAGRVAGSSRLARAAWRSHSSAFRGVTWSGVLVAARRYRRFPLFSSPSALLSTLAFQTPLLFLVTLYGPEAGGFYALASRLCSLPVTLIAGAVGQVFIAEAAQLARDRPGALRPLLRRTTLSLAGGAAGPAALLAIAAPVLAGPIFGEEWQQAGLYVAILVPMYYMAFVATATGDTLFVLERQGLHLVREIIRFGLIGGAIPVAAVAQLPPLGAIILLSVAGCLTYSLYALVTWRAIVTFRPDSLSSVPAAGTGLVSDAKEMTDL